MNWVQQSLIFGLRGYQRVVSPALAALLGPSARCRFEPSCSQYAIDAVRMHGAVKGGALAVWRVCRCNPVGGCGHDPVPPLRGKFKVQSLKFKVFGMAEPHACGASHAGKGRA